MVDSGSVVSVFPPVHRELKYLENKSKFLRAANGSSITTYGKRTERFSILGKNCKHDIIIVDVTCPILGANFFASGDGKDFCY